MASLGDARAAVVSYLLETYAAGGARPFLLGMETRMHADDLAHINSASQQGTPDERGA